MNIIEMLLGENPEYGVGLISLVDEPAIESDWIALSKDEEVILSNINDEKKLLLGAVLIPDKKIVRKDDNGEPYYIFFTKETIEATSQKYLKQKNQAEVNESHSKDLTGVTVVESWIKVDAKLDKSNAYGLNLPVGTWFVSMKVDNDQVWDDYIKTGKLKGFSIEGKFKGLPAKLEAEKLSDEAVMIEKIKELLTNKK